MAHPACSSSVIARRSLPSSALLLRRRLLLLQLLLSLSHHSCADLRCTGGYIRWLSMVGIRLSDQRPRGRAQAALRRAALVSDPPPPPPTPAAYRCCLSLLLPAAAGCRRRRVCLGLHIAPSLLRALNSPGGGSLSPAPALAGPAMARSAGRPRRRASPTSEDRRSHRHRMRQGAAGGRHARGCVFHTHTVDARGVSLLLLGCRCLRLARRRPSDAPAQCRSEQCRSAQCPSEQSAAPGGPCGKRSNQRDHDHRQPQPTRCWPAPTTPGYRLVQLLEKPQPLRQALELEPPA